MARKYLTPIDLTKNELQNARIQNLASAPSSPVTGQIYYDTALVGLYIYNGTSWALAGGIGSGTLSGRPAASAVASGTFYYATDNYLVYYSNNTTWQQLNNFGSSASTTTSIAGAAADGTSTNYARADHAHAGPGFGSVTAQTTYGLSSGSGSATTVARNDHTHGTPALSANAPSNISSISAANGSGTAPAKDDHIHGFSPSNFAISAFAAASADVSLGGFKLTNLATPVSSTDGATKGYVDGVAQGLDVKASVRVATTTSGTLGSSFNTGSVIDGVTLANGNRILIKNQSTASENGVYTVNNLGAPTRATDMDSAAEFASSFVFVEEGSTYADTGWTCTTNEPVVVGTTSIVFSQFSGAGTFTASNGVLLTGANFTFAPLSSGGLQTASGGASILKPGTSGLVIDSTGLYVGAGTGISVGATSVAIDTAVVVRKYATNVGDGSSTSITITHNLATRDVQVTLYDSATYAEVDCDVTHSTSNTTTLAFSTAPSSNAYKVVVFG